MLDKLLPYTQDDKRCGIKKATKARQRILLADKINEYRIFGHTDEQILIILND